MCLPVGYINNLANPVPADKSRVGLGQVHYHHFSSMRTKSTWRRTILCLLYLEFLIDADPETNPRRLLCNGSRVGEKWLPTRAASHSPSIYKRSTFSSVEQAAYRVDRIGHVDHLRVVISVTAVLFVVGGGTDYDQGLIHRLSLRPAKSAECLTQSCSNLQSRIHRPGDFLHLACYGEVLRPVHACNPCRPFAFSWHEGVHSYIPQDSVEAGSGVQTFTNNCFGWMVDKIDPSIRLSVLLSTCTTSGVSWSAIDAASNCGPYPDIRSG